MIKIDSEITIQELLKLHPRAITVFIKHRMLCVGCPARAFHTLEEVARIHGSTIWILGPAGNPLTTEGRSTHA
jgi:hybrid cluster-associated redox disulfide protein